VKVAMNPRKFENSEEKANKTEKNGWLCIVTTCCFLAGWVGSGKIWQVWLPACKAGALEFRRCHVGVMRIVMNDGK
jgi:hypothetical protein